MSEFKATQPQPFRRKNRGFQSTRWSVVQRASSLDPEVAMMAFSDLYEIYRPPVLRFLECSRNISPEKAEDIFQDYYLHLQGKGFFERASSDVGKLRNFMLKDLTLFLNNEWRKEHAEMRGGNRPHISLDDLTVEIASDVDDPAAEFDRQWALNILQLASANLKSDYKKSDKISVFEAFEPFLTGSDQLSHRKISKLLGVTDGNSRIMLWRLRQELIEKIREEIARTVNSKELLEDEISIFTRAFPTALKG